jgi:hypothetical protein
MIPHIDPVRTYYSFSQIEDKFNIAIKEIDTRHNHRINSHYFNVIGWKYWAGLRKMMTLKYEMRYEQCY